MGSKTAAKIMREAQKMIVRAHQDEGHAEVKMGANRISSHTCEGGIVAGTYAYMEEQVASSRHMPTWKWEPMAGNK